MWFNVWWKFPVHRVILRGQHACDKQFSHLKVEPPVWNIICTSNWESFPQVRLKLKIKQTSETTIYIIKSTKSVSMFLSLIILLHTKMAWSILGTKLCLRYRFTPLILVGLRTTSSKSFLRATADVLKLSNIGVFLIQTQLMHPHESWGSQNGMFWDHRDPSIFPVHLAPAQFLVLFQGHRINLQFAKHSCNPPMGS